MQKQHALRMSEEDTRMRSERGRHQNEHDHEVWLRCFAAAITGVLSGNFAEASIPEAVVQRCALIADAGLDEERRRRSAS